MKYLLLVFIVFNGWISNAQINELITGYWLPEKYVETAFYGNNDADKYLFPVEAFDFSKKFGEVGNKKKNALDTLINIQTYKSEPNSIATRRIKQNVYLLPYFYSYLNMKYIPTSTVDKYKNSKVYLIKEDRKIVLEVVNMKDTTRTYFINSINGYMFTDIGSAKKYFRHSGKK